MLSVASESDTGKPEGISKHPTCLPVLDPSKGFAPCIAGDWLTQIGPTMKSLSATATVWWNEVWEQAHALCRQWLEADLQEKLTVAATREGESSRHDGTKYVRVEQAAINLLLAALPEWLKTELVSNRQLDSTAIIFRMLTAFQPGGLTDRTAILEVSRPAPGKSAYDTLVALRTWQRLKKRAEEVNATIPDPSV